MAIGDTWETINTYAFVAGETIITADYENDVVNDLQYLYTHPNTGVNIYMQNTNTAVTLTANTNDINTGLSITFTPNSTKVMMLFYAYGQANGWDGTQYINFAYKVGTGAITYFTQEQDDSDSLVFQEVTGLTTGTSVTIAFYAKNTWPSTNRTMQVARVLIWEKAN